jgi:hypothetical protein
MGLGGERARYDIRKTALMSDMDRKRRLRRGQQQILRCAQDDSNSRSFAALSMTFLKPT